MEARAGAARLGGGAATCRSAVRLRQAPDRGVQGSACRVNMPRYHAARVRSVRFFRGSYDLVVRHGVQLRCAKGCALQACTVSGVQVAALRSL